MGTIYHYSQGAAITPLSGPMRASLMSLLSLLQVLKVMANSMLPSKHIAACKTGNVPYKGGSSGGLEPTGLAEPKPASNSTWQGS